MSDAGPALRVPAESLTRDGSPGGARVWAIRDRRGLRGTCVPVDVVVEDEADGWATVRGDLNPGDLIAVTAESLSAGQLVRMLPAQGSAS